MALALPLLAMGCSSDPPRRDDSPKGWAACNEIFGDRNIDSLVAAMGKGTVRIENQLVTGNELTDALTHGARRWKPGSDAHFGSSFAPCQVAVPENRERFSTEVRWSTSSFSRIKSGEDSIAWREVGSGIFASEDGGVNILRLAIPCKVPSAHIKQESGLPLEIAIRVKRIPQMDTALRGKMVSAVAKKLSQKIPCENRPNIPDEVGRHQR